ncbi:MAG: hypothetical protein RIB45_08280 [Marivibrio sp.]|uniref:hypothetical protein n=1 Tax=Marivibrio sp. TaxID=2039719 RepID=UPI0032F02862
MNGVAPPNTAALYQAAQLQLGRIMAPVTAEILRDSLPADEGGTGDGYRWSKMLWAITAIFLLCVLAAQMYRTMTGLDGRIAGGDAKTIWDALVVHVSPFVYGGLGACVHLLRTCHKHLAARTFSRLRKQEYLSRILLGVIAGGAVLLMAENVYDDGARVNLLSAALAFLAGFNVDFLYQALDRVANAVLPKVGLDSVQERPALRGGAIDPQALLEFIETAKTPEAKAAAQKLLDALAPPDKPTSA